MCLCTARLRPLRLFALLAHCSIRSYSCRVRRCAEQPPRGLWRVRCASCGGTARLAQPAWFRHLVRRGALRTPQPRQSIVSLAAPTPPLISAPRPSARPTGAPCPAPRQPGSLRSVPRCTALWPPRGLLPPLALRQRPGVTCQCPPTTGSAHGARTRQPPTRAPPVCCVLSIGSNVSWAPSRLFSVVPLASSRHRRRHEPELLGDSRRFARPCRVSSVRWASKLVATLLKL